MKAKLVLVTGGLGFIGKHFVKRCLDLGAFVTNVDIVNYAADRFANEEFKAHSNYRHIEAAGASLGHLPECDWLVNLAAESHVDKSIPDRRKFFHSNLIGAQRLLELTRAKTPSGAPHFPQISTG